MSKRTNIFFLLLFCGLLALPSLPCSAQAVPPQKVREGLLKKYPGEAPIIYGWRQLGDTAYLATFIYQGSYRYTKLNQDGWWQEEGVALDRSGIPQEIWEAIPELDITAFVYESFQARNRNDQQGYMIVYETDVERIDLFVTNKGEVVRKDHYPIPGSAEEEEPASEPSDEVDWGDG